MTLDPSGRIQELMNPAHFQYETVNCYLCKKNECTEFLIGEDDLTGKDGKFLYVKCNGCDLVYQNPRLNIGAIKEFYDSEYIAHRKKKDWGVLTPLYEWAMNKLDRDKEKLVKKYFPVNRSTRLLDVGCAVGTFLLHMNEKYDCKISGVDFKEGLDYPGFNRIDFHEGVFYDQNIPSESMDLITMWHFFEHDYDPRRSLETARKVLTQNGKLIIEVPRLDSFTFKLFKNKWPGVQAPQHTALYTRKTLNEILETNGFEIEAYLPYGAFPPYFYIFTGTYFKLIGKGLNLDRIIVPYFLGQFLLFPILLFKNYLNLSMQTVVCKKSW